MASNTPNLNLLKKDPVTDGNDTFNIQTMLNDNWDKIDEAIGDVREELQDINIPPASLTEAGIVRLSNSTSGTREDVAATELAVKTTYDAAAAAQTTANAANLAAAAAQTKADQAFQLGNERKAEVVAALVALGVSASTSDSWATLISKLTAIIKATGNATAADVLAGKTFSNASANGLIGTMPKFSPGDYEIYRGSGYASSRDYMVKLYEVKVSNINTSIIRVGIINLYSYLVDSTAYAQIYINGNPRGVMRSTPGGNQASFFEDFICNENDSIELWARTTNTKGNVVAELSLRISIPSTVRVR